MMVAADRLCPPWNASQRTLPVVSDTTLDRLVTLSVSTLRHIVLPEHLFLLLRKSWIS